MIALMGWMFDTKSWDGQVGSKLCLFLCVCAFNASEAHVGFMNCMNGWLALWFIASWLARGHDRFTYGSWDDIAFVASECMNLNL